MGTPYRFPLLMHAPTRHRYLLPRPDVDVRRESLPYSLIPPYLLPRPYIHTSPRAIASPRSPLPVGERQRVEGAMVVVLAGPLGTYEEGAYHTTEGGIGRILVLGILLPPLP